MSVITSSFGDSGIPFLGGPCGNFQLRRIEPCVPVKPTTTASISQTIPRLEVTRRSFAFTLFQGASAVTRRIDRVVLSLVSLMLVLLIFDAQLARRTAGYVASELAHLAPWFTLSVFFAAAAKATGGGAFETFLSHLLAGCRGSIGQPWMPMSLRKPRFSSFCLTLR
jgi:hypothetical protein